MDESGKLTLREQHPGTQTRARQERLQMSQWVNVSGEPGEFVSARTRELEKERRHRIGQRDRSFLRVCPGCNANYASVERSLSFFIRERDELRRIPEYRVAIRQAHRARNRL